MSLASTTEGVRSPHLVGRPDRVPTEVARNAGSVLGERVDDVALHTGPDVDALTSQHGVLALALGRTVALSSRVGAPTSLTGQAVLAHELAHVVQQDGADGMAMSGRVHDPAVESEADAVAVQLVGRSLGVAPSGPVRPQRRGGLALRGCTPGEALSSAEIGNVNAAVTSVAGSTPIIEKAIRDAYGTSFENMREDPEIKPGTHLALTKNGYTRLATSSLQLAPGQLGALIIHEMSHLRDPTNGMGLADALEGYAYAFEVIILRRALAAMAPTDPKRQAIVDRIAVVEGLYAKPPALANLAPAYRANYDAMTQALELLYRAIDGVAITWGASGEPPGWSPMTSDKAQRTVVWLLQTSSTELRKAGGGFGADLLNWVAGHAIEVAGILHPAPPAPPPTTTPTPAPSGSGSGAPPKRPAPPFRPPRRDQPLR